MPTECQISFRWESIGRLGIVGLFGVVWLVGSGFISLGGEAGSEVLWQASPPTVASRSREALQPTVENPSFPQKVASESKELFDRQDMEKCSSYADQPSDSKELFDGYSLTGWKVLDELAFKSHGNVEVREGQILLHQGEPFTGIRWTGPFPRSNYELLVEARRVEGDDFFCGLVFPVGQADCSLIVGGWGGSTVGLSNIDGEPAAENETAAICDFEKGRWYAIRLRVTDQKIQLWIDQEKIVDFQYPDRKLSIRWDQEPMRPFGICTWRTTGAVRKVQLRRLPKQDPPSEKNPAKPAPASQEKSFSMKPLPSKVAQTAEEGPSVSRWYPTIYEEGRFTESPPPKEGTSVSFAPPTAGQLPTPFAEAVVDLADGTFISPPPVAPGPLPTALGARSEFVVPKTFDGKPALCQAELQKIERGFRIYRLWYPSPVQTPVEQNNTIPAEYYMPEGAEVGSPRPAVIVLHILNGNYELERLLCRTLALRGIPALMFKLPYYDERAPTGGRKRLLQEPELFVQALPQAIADCRRTLDVLGARPEVDPAKISLAGISLGGIVGATAAAADSRVHRAALILAGGDLLAIIRHCREARPLHQFLQALPADRRQLIENALREIDPLSYASALRDRAKADRVLMVNAAQDEVIPRACTEKLAQALGMADRVIWLDGLGHYTAIAALPETLAQTTAFFAQDLPPEVKPPVAETPKPGTPLQLTADLVKQLLDIFVHEPSEGRCHLLDISAEVVDPAGKKYEGRLRWVRGAQHRFRLEVNMTGLPEVQTGQGDRPWLASAKRVFVGRTKDGQLAGQDAPSGQARLDPLKFVPDRHLVRAKAWLAALQGLGQMPTLLESLLEAEELQGPSSAEPESAKPPTRSEQSATNPSRLPETPAPEQTIPPGRLLLLRQKNKKQNTLQIVLTPEGRPSRLELSVDKFRAKITVHAWQLEAPAPEGLFAPPDRPIQEVDPEDLVRIWSALVEFWMEKTE